MGRKRVSGSELARRMGRSQAWVSRRIVGAVALDWDDMDQIAKALDVPLSDLLPSGLIGGSRTGSSLTIDLRDPHPTLPFPGRDMALATN